MSDTLFGDLMDPAYDVLKTADISEDGLYRYSLNRTWGDPKDRVVWVMLNPSTADHALDDPTIRRCMGFARDWGRSGISVVNLYAFRATKPADCFAAADPVGPRNDQILRRALANAASFGVPVIAAWGANAKPERVAQVRAMPHAGQLHHLGLTKGGAPKHPLYLPKTTTPTRWTA